MEKFMKAIIMHFLKNLCNKIENSWFIEMCIIPREEFGREKCYSPNLNLKKR